MESIIPAILGTTVTGRHYRNIIAPLEVPDTPHALVCVIWEAYENAEIEKGNSQRGKMLEYTVCESLARFGVGPLYFQGKFYGLLYDQYDIAAWTQDGYPIIISCKTSLRERWKQADLEGRLLKLRFTRSKSYLITLEPNEAANTREKIENGEAAGLDQVYLADQPEFDDFVESMRTAGLVAVSPILPLTGRTFGGPADQ